MPQDQSSYEEVRNVVVDILLGKVRLQNPVSQFVELLNGVHSILSGNTGSGQNVNRTAINELTRDVFWDLFRQGYITLGLNHDNERWPFFRLSYFGQKTLAQRTPYRFHDSSSYLKLVHDQAPGLSRQAFRYLDEAVQTFYAGCLLASTVMLGVAAECVFEDFIETASALPSVGRKFHTVQKERFISGKIRKFVSVRDSLRENLDHNLFEDIETQFSPIQSVLRIARNETGHPSDSSPPSRENIYVNLQLFIPFAKKLAQLESALHAYETSSNQVATPESEIA